MAGRNPIYVKATAENVEQVEQISENLRDAASKLFDAAREMEQVNYLESKKLWAQARKINSIAWLMDASAMRLHSQPNA